MKLITLFSGIGMQEFGIRECGIDYNLINYCEYDSKISNCFDIIHNTNQQQNIGDITKLDINKYMKTLKKNNNLDIDVMISSFPCQSFSIAGKQKGFSDNKNGGLFDCQFKLIKKILPKIVIYENVKNIKSKKFNAVEKIEQSMNDIGYIYFHKILNSVHYGIPQNRERWFMVCFKIEHFGNDIVFNFPEPLQLTTIVENYLEDNVENRKVTTALIPYFDEQYLQTYKSHKGMKKVFDGVSQEHFKSGFTTHRIYSIKGVSPTFTTSNDCHFYEIKGKLTSRERWRLMGLKDDDYDKLKENDICDGLIHKICGNGIVVDVFRELFKEIMKVYDCYC